MQVAIPKAMEIQVYRLLCGDDHRAVIGRLTREHQISAPTDVDQLVAGSPHMK